jgi:hypothetical protein
MAVDKSPRDYVRGGDADARLLAYQQNGCLDAATPDYIQYANRQWAKAQPAGWIFSTSTSKRPIGRT